MRLQTTVLVTLVSISVLHLSPAIAQGTAFTYQGRLNDGASPAGGIYDLRFTIYDSDAGADAVAGPVTNAATAVSNGLFTVTIDPGAGVFDGSDRWLEIGVRSNGVGAFTMLSPRQQITATPYAVRAATADAAGLVGAIPSSSLSGIYSEPLDFNNTANNYNGTFYGSFLGLSFIGGSFSGAFIGNGSGLGNLNGSQISSGTIPSAALNNSWRTVGNAGTSATTNFLGTTDNQPLELRVNNRRILRLEPNVNNSPNILVGSVSNSISAGVEGATIAGGGIGLYPNTITANYATIGGGTFHTVNGEWSTIAGGRDNMIQADHSAIAGGRGNIIRSLASYSTIAGGVFNGINTNADYSTVSGGYFNDVGTNSLLGVIGGGYENNSGIL